MNLIDLYEMRDRRDAYQRDHDNSVSGMDRGRDHRGLGQELAHERNNIQIAINGRPWKVVAGKGTADSAEESNNLESMKQWAERKSASSDKKWTVYLTGAEVSESQGMAEAKKKAVPSNQRDPGALATRQHIAGQEHKHRDWAQKQKELESEFYANHPELDDRKGVAEGSLNELSKDTLKSYAKKAVPDMQASQKRSEIEAGKAASTKDDKTAKTHYDAAKQARDRTEKRMAGISGAIKRVTNQGVAEAVEDRTSYQVAKALFDYGIKYDPARENDLIKAIGMVLVKELNMSPRMARSVMNDEDFLGDTLGELRHMESGMAESELNEFLDPQAVAQDPGLEREPTADVVIFGRMPQDFTFDKVVQALEAVLPREYPPGSSPTQQGMPDSPAELKGSEIAKNSGAVVTTKPLSTAQKVVKEFQARGIKCKLIAKPGMNEGKADYNFDIEDLKRLETIRDLSTLKTQALALISKPSAKPMKPEKVEWFKNALERMNSPLKVIKLMYDLLLSGEGNAVVGSRSSMNPNSYRQRFSEQGMAEADVDSDGLKGKQGEAAGSLTEDLQADDGEYYSNSDKFFGQFEINAIDFEESPDGMELRGYIDGVNVMAWRFKSAKKVGGWGIYDDSTLSQQGVTEAEVDSDGHSVDHADSGEYDYEGDQARDQMNTIVRAARRLDGLLDDNENMPEWVQMKVTLAADYLDTAADYIESNQEPELDEGDRGRGRPPAGEQDTTPITPGRVEKTATGIRHHADASRYGGTEPDAEDDHLMSKSHISRLGKMTEPDLDEGDKIGNMDADKFDAAMARLKQLAGAGPLKTVYDPTKRVYRNVPVAVQPKK